MFIFCTHFFFIFAIKEYRVLTFCFTLLPLYEVLSSLALFISSLNYFYFDFTFGITVNSSVATFDSPYTSQSPL